jgi:signal recognition particle subunit SEC65
MTAEQISDMAEYLEKLGYEIIKIKEKKEAPDFPYSPAKIRIELIPVKSKAKKMKPRPEDIKQIRQKTGLSQVMFAGS